ncbi:hypothetical protein A3J43_00875 [Candidatus Uhrbacteria bacterium RIFCSPHIGHO2_12_FULL_54_23]|uniref:Uncharacterized protein n=2 Tax=Candidatus Uhriibacteriota TaxID=1752732 RepID=A0A1F7UKV2_9BACT|nr:MAG: hypothetical protein A3J43_00875 [Candidatus Uhrbacteria bacterium RIFCSPHIGHO2_12_FULL_54_23]OGL90805.1 MAG: hypothetical protein A3J36_03430 [Candidatus Uhrbacteria bacterium RIFCSPLOWO2_02_FULL_54_37]
MKTKVVVLKQKRLELKKSQFEALVELFRRRQHQCWLSEEGGLASVPVVVDDVVEAILRDWWQS